MKSLLSSIALATAMSGWVNAWTHATNLQKKTTDSTAIIFTESETISPQLQAIIDRNNQSENNANVSKLISLWVGLMAWAGMWHILNRRNKNNENPLETYEKNIPDNQKAGWNRLTESEKSNMLSFWPKWIHWDIKQWTVGDCYLQAILVGLKNNADAYLIFKDIIKFEGDGYGVTFGRLLSMWNLHISVEDIKDINKIGYTGQMWDYIITRAYYKFRSNEAKGINIKKHDESTMLPDNTWKRIFDWWNVAETYYNITWYTLSRQYNMNDWIEWSSMGTFSYHPSADEYYTITPWITYDNHAYIITSYDQKSGIITYENPHDTSKKLQIHKDTLLKLPKLCLNYSEFGVA